jgi:hypothetical protein
MGLGTPSLAGFQVIMAGRFWVFTEAWRPARNYGSESEKERKRSVLMIWAVHVPIDGNRLCRLSRTAFELSQSNRDRQAQTAVRRGQYLESVMLVETLRRIVLRIDEHGEHTQFDTRCAKHCVCQ